MTVPTNDHWTLELQELGMAQAGDELAELILRCRPPFAICVQGKWGAGKTSLMRYAMARLGGKPLGTTLKTSDKPSIELPDSLHRRWREIGGEAHEFIFKSLREQLEKPRQRNVYADEVRVTSIWFNPWQHQAAGLPLAALLHELRAQLTFGQRSRDETKKLLQVSLEAGLTILGELIDGVSKLYDGMPLKMGDGLGRIRTTGEAYEVRNFETRSDAQRFNLLFEQAVARLLGENVEGDEDERWRDGGGREVPAKRLVIFIDDLDRCSEPQVLALLESIKLYLQTRYCVFVLGMDGTAARRAVAKSLPGSTREHAQEYLEKLFQATIQVPVCSNAKPFLKGIVDGASLSAQPHCVDLLASLLEPNPRKMKNFVNGLGIAWRCAGKAAQKAGVEAFVLVHYLRLYHPDVYRLITYERKHVKALHAAVTENPPAPPRDTVGLLFRRAFRHALPFVGPLERAHEDALVDELVDRLDRHKGDSEFLAAWKKRYERATPDEVAAELGCLFVTEMAP